MSRALQLLFVVTLVFFFVSCGKLGEDDLTEREKMSLMETLLPQAQLQLAQTTGHDHAVFVALITQQVAGVQGKTLQVEKYNITSQDVDISWISWYSQVLSLLRTVKETADDLGQKKYAAVSRILIAQAAASVTDAWGDIPLSQSILLDNIANFPTYDSQEMVYNQLLDLLDQADVLLAEAAGFFFPAEDDVYFAGDVQQWRSLSFVLRLRFMLTLSSRRGYQSLLPLLNNEIVWSSGEGLRINFEAHEFMDHPVYVYNVNHSGGLRAGATLLEVMGTDDPRLGRYFRLNNASQYAGSPAGTGDLQASRLADAIAGAGASYTLASFTELQFIIAEVYLQSGQLQQAREALYRAMVSSLADQGVSADSWVEQYLNENPVDMQTLMHQKYIALVLQPQNWNDWRRTGFPVLEPSQGNATADRIPRRFPYPANEYQYNSQNVPQNINLWEAVWWDTQNQL
ncbi:MAG: SusD/RagB family nutrient-binding outer membrane lipoprotein [Bacteroidales bacterium]